MIYESLTCLAEEMNIFFKSKLKISEDKVIVSAIVNQDGSIAIQGENKVLITLVNMTKEIGIKRESSISNTTNANKPICLNLSILLSCYFTAGNYAEALRFLSFVISFLQTRNVFDHSNTPRLDNAIEKLVFEMESYEADRLSNIWTTLGAKYMPSVLYKARMIVLDATQVREYRPAVTGIAADI
jgi:hypothetical protein